MCCKGMKDVRTVGVCWGVNVLLMCHWCKELVDGLEWDVIYWRWLVCYLTWACGHHYWWIAKLFERLVVEQSMTLLWTLLSWWDRKNNPTNIYFGIAINSLDVFIKPKWADKKKTKYMLIIYKLAETTFHKLNDKRYPKLINHLQFPKNKRKFHHKIETS